MEPLHKIKRAKDILLAAATENKRLIAQILEFADIVEDVLSYYEMEILSYQVAIRKEIISERWVIAILETYGIDKQIALGRRDARIKSDYDLAINHQIYRTPEKLKDYIDEEKINEDENNKYIDELIELRPDKKDEIISIFKTN